MLSTTRLLLASNRAPATMQVLKRSRTLSTTKFQQSAFCLKPQQQQYKRYYSSDTNGSNSSGKSDTSTDSEAMRNIALGAGVFLGATFLYNFTKSKVTTKKSSNDNTTAPTSKTDDKNSTLGLSPLPKDTTVIFVLGGPGAGKGTQCSNLVKDFGFVHLSAGDLLRAEKAKPNSPYGDLINTYIKEGKIVPMEITIALLHSAMKSSTSNRFLVDGFPRAMDQALKFEQEVVNSKFVLYFECPEEEMLKRLLKRGETSGRDDDNISSIKKRFKTFQDTSFPVIQHYDRLNKVRKVSCLQSVESVYKETKQIVEKML